jgi:hypothetical protein
MEMTTIITGVSIFILASVLFFFLICLVSEWQRRQEVIEERKEHDEKNI